ncbi:MAG: hypothetical protein EHM48_07680, partial [Planctomycetaceae bacterium]
MTMPLYRQQAAKSYCRCREEIFCFRRCSIGNLQFEIPQSVASAHVLKYYSCMNTQTKPIIVVSEPLNERTLAYLNEHAQVRQVTADEAINVIADADGLVVRTYTQVNEQLLAKAGRLKVVGRAG